MSGGHFDYQQYHLEEIADAIDDLIVHNGSTELNDWGDRKYRDYPPDIINEFKRGANLLRKAQIYAQRIDWLVSDDDGPDSFRSRLKANLAGLKPYEVDK